METKESLSTADLEAWPNPLAFLKPMQSLAVLSACENDLRRYSVKKHASLKVIVGEMDNGQGDSCRLIFATVGMVISGFAHEAVTSSLRNSGPYEGTYEGFPDEFAKMYEHLLDEEDVSFCAWYLNSEGSWQRGRVELPDDEEDPDGSEHIFEYLPFDPLLYAKLEGEYYGREFDIEAVQAIYAHEPLTEDLIKRVNPHCSYARDSVIFRDIGYPIA